MKQSVGKAVLLYLLLVGALLSSRVPRAEVLDVELSAENSRTVAACTQRASLGAW